jgi:hypothetical protein
MATGVQILDTSAWPFGGTLLLRLAQEAADERRHAVFGAAHVAGVLLEMQPVRSLLGDAAAQAPLDAAVSRSLLRTSKHLGRGATLDPRLVQVLVGRVVGTADVMRLAAASDAELAAVLGPLTDHADAVAALLDADDVRALLSAPGSAAAGKRCPQLALAFADATKRKHRSLTTRHVVASALRTFDGMLAKRGLPGLGAAVARVEALLEREPRRTDDTLQLAPRLAGAVAGAIADRDTPLLVAVVRQCVAGDDAVAFAKDAINRAVERIRSAERPA